MDALQAKLAAENALPGHEVMVTAGANQAFVNIVLTLLEADDRAVLFRPYYFQPPHGAAGVPEVELWPLVSAPSRYRCNRTRHGSRQVGALGPAAYTACRPSWRSEDGSGPLLLQTPGGSWCCLCLSRQG